MRQMGGFQREVKMKYTKKNRLWPFFQKEKKKKKPKNKQTQEQPESSFIASFSDFILNLKFQALNPEKVATFIWPWLMVIGLIGWGYLAWYIHNARVLVIFVSSLVVLAIVSNKEKEEPETKKTTQRATI